MTITDPIDAGRLGLLLNDLRLPAIKTIWADFASRADAEGWPAARFLAVLAEHEVAERARRRFERRLDEARLPPGKTLATFDFDAVPMVSQAQVMALAAGDSWIDKGANLVLFGPPGGGKSHLGAALGLALVEHGWRVLFTRTTDLSPEAPDRPPRARAGGRHRQARQVPPPDPRRPRLRQQGPGRDQRPVRTHRRRYERRSMLITANQPFGDWGKVFPDPTMTLAAIDRIVHHSTILEMNVGSYRRRSALVRRRSQADLPSARQSTLSPD